MSDVINLLRQIRTLIPNQDLVKQIDNAIAAEDVVENVGDHEVGSHVLFQPPAYGQKPVLAKVVRNRATAQGNVLYDLALQLTYESDKSIGVEIFFDEKYPIRGVFSAYVSPTVEKSETDLTSHAIPA